MNRPTLIDFATVKPIFVQRYKRYLPTAFDESLTLLEKMNAIIEFMNTVSENSDKLIEQWNTVMEWLLDHGMEQAVEERLVDWDETGRLDDIINRKIFNDLRTELFNSIDALDDRQLEQFFEFESDYRKNSDLITLGDLAQDVKTALTGGSVAVTGVDSVGSINLNQKAVTEYEMDVIQQNKNLFVKESATMNKTLTTEQGESKVEMRVIDLDHWFISDYIRVVGGRTLYKSHEGSVYFLDENKERVDSVPNSTQAQSIDIPTDAYYIRISSRTRFIDDYQIAYGSTSSEYVEGKFKLKDRIKIDNENITDVNGTKVYDGTLPLDKIEDVVESKNILNPNKFIEGYYVNRTSGELGEAYSNNTIDYTRVKDNVFTVNPTNAVVNTAFYDKDKVFISGNQLTADTTDRKVDVPENAVYFRLSYSGNTPYEGMMASWGSTVDDYERYYKYPLDFAVKSEVADNSEGGSNTPSTLQVTNAYDVRFITPLTDTQFSSYRYSNDSTGDDFMKGRESSIFTVDSNGSFNKSFDVSHEASNKEFALRVNNGTDEEWFPEHNGIATAFEGSNGFRSLQADGKDVPLNTPSEPIAFKKAVLTQKMECRLPSDLSTRAIITLISTIEDGENLNEIYIQWKQNTTVENGYIFMTPLNPVDFVDQMLTGKLEYLLSDPDATESYNTELDNGDTKKFIFTSNRTGKEHIVFTTEILENTMVQNRAYWQHRAGSIEKLYPIQYSNTEKLAGQVDYFKGKYSIKAVPDANKAYRL